MSLADQEGPTAKGSRDSRRSMSRGLRSPSWRLTPQLSGRVLRCPAKSLASPSSSANAIANVRGHRCVNHANDLQFDSRTQRLEHSTSTAKQHRNLVYLQLIQHTCLERALRRVRTV